MSPTQLNLIFKKILTCNECATCNQIILKKLFFFDAYVIDFTNQHVLVIMKNLKNIKNVIF